MTTKHDTHAATLADNDPATKAAPSLNDAARDVLSALGHIGPTRLGHGYGCPSEHAGPCTCGTAELLVAATGLEEALSAPPAG